MTMTRSELVERIFKRLPGVDQIDLESRASEIRFRFDGYTYQVSEYGDVNKVEGNFLTGGTIPKLLTTILKLP